MFIHKNDQILATYLLNLRKNDKTSPKFVDSQNKI